MRSQHIQNKVNARLGREKHMNELQQCMQMTHHKKRKLDVGVIALESRYSLQSIRAISLEGAEGIIPIYIEYIYTNVWISLEGREDPIPA